MITNFTKKAFWVLVLLVIACCSNSAWAQTHTVSGVVTDQRTGDPLPGVNILVLDTSTGTSTNADGEYELTVNSAQDTLRFSYIGYKPRLVPINARTTIDVKLNMEVVRSEEDLVVVGYGTQEKENLTGSVSTVSASELEDRPVMTVGQALQGQVANLNMTTTSGRPGAQPDFNIRGFESINGGSPLVLVDGVQMNPNLINPNDIESVSVLKDAAASAIYGVRGAFGVILINTKSGNKNTPLQVNLSSNYSFNTPTNIPQNLESLPFANLMNTAQQNANGTNFYDEETMGYIRRYYNDPANNPSSFIHSGTTNGLYTYAGNTNWAEETYRNTYPMWQNTASLSGGSENTSYYGSYGYNTQEGLFQFYDEQYRRHNINFNIRSDIFDWLTVFGKTTYNLENRDYPNQSVGTSESFVTADTRPTIPVYQPEGTFGGLGANGEFTNPIAVQQLGGYQNYTINDRWLTGGLVVTPIDKVEINFDYSYNAYSREYERFAREFGQFGIDGEYIKPFPHTSPNGVRLTTNNDEYTAINLYGTYDDTFADIHNFKATVGFNQEQKHYKFFVSERQNLINNNLPAINQATGQQFVNGSERAWAVRGGFFRFNYNFDERYLLEVNGRYDGTSRFADDERYVFYPSASAGWRISEEAFMEPLAPYLSNLKLRYSLGSIGNQGLTGTNLDGVNLYPYIPTMGSGQINYLLNGEQPLAIGAAGLVSPSLTWEEVTTSNIGVDFGFLDDRLTGSYDYYIRRTTDMLTAGSPVPAVLGTAVPQQNAADLRVQGWDLQIDWADRFTNGSYSIGLVMSDNRAEITRFNNPNNILSNYYEGRRIGEIWGFTSEGLFQSQEEVQNAADHTQVGWGGQRAPGDVHYTDLNGDGVINYGENTLENPGDRTIIGNSQPRYSFGFKTNVQWKGFDLRLFFQGVLKRDIAVQADPWFFGSLTGAFPQYIAPRDFNADYWTPENPDAYFHRPNMSNWYGNTVENTRYLQDGKYIRLRNLTFGYTLPADLTQRANISRVKVFFSGENIWEASAIDFDAFDPEIQQGIIYPIQRSYALGINISI